MNRTACFIALAILALTISLPRTEVTASEPNVEISEMQYKKLKRLAKNGAPEAMAVLGLLYYHGQEPSEDAMKVERNRERGINWLRKAASRGNAVAQYQMAKILAEEDLEASRKMLTNSAEKNFTKAKQILNIEEEPETKEEQQVRAQSPQFQSSGMDIKEDNTIVVKANRETIDFLIESLEPQDRYGTSTGSRIKGRRCEDNPLCRVISGEMAIRRFLMQ